MVKLHRNQMGRSSQVPQLLDLKSWLGHRWNTRCSTLISFCRRKSQCSGHESATFTWVLLIRIPLFEVCETKNRCRGFNPVFFTEQSPGRVFQKALAGKFWPGPILSQSLWCPTFRNSTRDEQISGLEPIPKRNQSLHFRIGFSFLSCDHTKAPQFNVAQKLPRSSVRMREL